MRHGLHMGTTLMTLILLDVFLVSKKHLEDSRKIHGKLEINLYNSAHKKVNVIYVSKSTENKCHCIGIGVIWMPDLPTQML